MTFQVLQKSFLMPQSLATRGTQPWPPQEPWSHGPSGCKGFFLLPQTLIFLVIQVTHCQPYPRPPYIQTLAPPKRHKTTKEKKQFIICYNSLSLNEHRMMKLKVCIITQTKKQRRDVLSWKVQ